ncbi:MAG: hypothetical protein J0L84_09335 [Verrucomicrobia bacterium]|nr:hypothetical protein [Verrucomicrobiota bacterium]
MHDHKTPVAPHDWKEGNREGRSVVVRAHGTDGRVLAEVPMRWYGESLWRAHLPHQPEIHSLTLCATDAAGNTACFPVPAPPPE